MLIFINLTLLIYNCKSNENKSCCVKLCLWVTHFSTRRHTLQESSSMSSVTSDNTNQHIVIRFSSLSITLFWWLSVFKHVSFAPMSSNNHNTAESSSPVEMVVQVAISLKMPPFWNQDLVLLFAHIKAQFASSRISSEATHHTYIIGLFSLKIMNMVRDLILAPGSFVSYDTFKSTLI